MNELITAGAGAVAVPQNELSTDIYLRFVAFLDVGEKSTQTYTRDLRQMFQFFADNGISKPQREDIISYRESLKARGLKPTTIQNYVTAARLFFKWAEQERIYPNVADHIKGAKLDREHKKDYLTSSQCKNVLSGIDRSTLIGKRDYAIVSLVITGALRTIEVRRADIGDLRTLGDMTVLYLQGKGRDEKTEYSKIQPVVEKAIREYLKARGETDPKAPLFVSDSNNSRGGRLSTRTISGICKSAMKDAGYDSERLTAHSLRHTGVTLALLNGASLQEAQEYARHSNISTTMIYNHALEKSKNGCSKAVTAAIFG